MRVVAAGYEKLARWMEQRIREGVERSLPAVAHADSERLIRWLIALMVLCCDPLAIALTAAASSRR